MAAAKELYKVSKRTIRVARRVYRKVEPYLPGPTFDNFFNLFYYTLKLMLEAISLMLSIWSLLIPS